MKIHKSYIIVGLILAFAFFFEVAAHADESDLMTKITFDQPVAIPGQTLAPGTYLFKLLSSDSDRHIVQIYNAGGTRLYAMVQAISADRLVVSSNSILTFANQGDGQPEALVKWFYPGNDMGEEFLYPKEQEKQLASDQHKTVTASEHGASIAPSVLAGE
jgi:hypothetical protein